MTKTLELSKRDSEIFAEAMLDPSEPNEALREAARVYKERVGDEQTEYTDAWDELGLAARYRALGMGKTFGGRAIEKYLLSQGFERVE